MRFARLLSTFAASFAVAGLAASAPSCSKSSDTGGGDGGDDGMSAIDLDSTLPPSDASTCDPCQSVCACTPGDTFYNQARCGFEVCGANGRWGGVSCTVGPGCPACDPCKELCACTPFDFVFVDAACTIETCPQNGVWGQWDCAGCLPEGGVDGGDDSEPMGDAQSDDGSLDGDAAGGG